ncbi:hypothetical protein ACP1UU_004441 [Vibrio alginolyticus]|uniref:hypothetical protein n=1 Tax=Vibrio parahaemolyticus TaxID=670 RepID=UPI002362F511|nr:hypothetical protein [Vibrio parahaemolyticus]
MEIDVNWFGSWASIVGLVISIVGAIVSLITLFRVKQLKKEYIFVSRASEYHKVISESHDKLNDYFQSEKDLDYTGVRETFKGVEETLSTLLKIFPKDYEMARKDLKSILKVIKRAEGRGVVLGKSELRKAKESLANVTNSIPHIIENQKFS